MKQKVWIALVMQTENMALELSLSLYTENY